MYSTGADVRDGVALAEAVGQRTSPCRSARPQEQSLTLGRSGVQRPRQADPEHALPESRFTPSIRQLRLHRVD